MKRIVFITPHYYPSTLTGSGIVVMKLAEEFAKKNYDVSIITSNALTARYWYDPFFGKKVKNKFEILHKVKVYRLPCNQLYSSVCFSLIKIFNNNLPKRIFDYLKFQASGPYLMGIYDLLSSQHFDIVHCSPAPLIMNNQVVEAIGKLKKKPKLIITPFFHSYVEDFANPILKKIFDKADVIHVITAVEGQDISKRFVISKNKMKIIPLFLDISHMHSVDELKNEIFNFKDKYKLKERKIILFAGIKGHAKGAIDLLLSINMLYKTNPEYILVAIGTDTNEWKQAKTKIDKRCVLDLEYKTGKEKEIIFASCDIFCMPSKSETFGLVYLEAWHKEKPVIVANIPAVREFIGSCGIFVQYGDRKQIIRAIEKISKNTSMAKMFGKIGHDKLINKYTFSKIYPNYSNLFT